MITISFIGALNVGSIYLHFDDSLKTNVSKPEHPYISDKNYLLLMKEDESNDMGVN
jgi:hypothetical protein